MSALSAQSKNFVKQAIAAWTGNSAQVAAHRKQYFGEPDKTKIAYVGTTNLDRRGDYVRSGGPHVWIAFSCQNGIVFRDQIYYHTIWRDRKNDYGAAFSF